jgi:hypothetical protein
MHTYIKKLHAKPEHIRKRIFVGALFVSMTFVIAVWIFSLGYRFNPTTGAKARADLKPFALLGQSLSDTYNNITASVGSIPSLTGATPQTNQEKQISVVPVESQN